MFILLPINGHSINRLLEIGSYVKCTTPNILLRAQVFI
jgi:hypothetical protein